MKEKELRFALVCFGGVSLAIYMHGITKEVLKLVRASSTLHKITDRAKRSNACFADFVDGNDPEYDSEAVYFELLRELGRKVELRVIVDIIAGASAGGINGTMLARALSHDLPMARLRDLWLDHADVSELLAPEARARGWSKWFLRPLFWAFGGSRLEFARDAEVRAKLSMFVRSRWFKPPLDGMRMAGLMYDAVTAMGRPKSPEASLLPSGHGLDLFVTVTDYYGSQQLVHIHDPAIIHERVHRHLFHFKYRRRANGEVESDFDLANAPALPSPRGRLRRSQALFRRRVSWRWTSWCAKEARTGRAATISSAVISATIWRLISIPHRRRLLTAAFSTIARSAKRSGPSRGGRPIARWTGGSSTSTPIRGRGPRGRAIRRPVSSPP